jgi:hypothetical protein
MTIPKKCDSPTFITGKDFYGYIFIRVEDIFGTRGLT